MFTKTFRNTKSYLKLTLLLTITSSAPAQTRFKNHQLTFERVNTAYSEKWANLQAELRQAGVKGPFKLYMAAYKKEGELQLWVQSANEQIYKVFRTYTFCKHSGTLGTKVKEGIYKHPKDFITLMPLIRLVTSTCL